ncbi:MAG: NUDIX domain-containing protein [Oscillatoria sp. PMC 1068.18]|nr:NUDIX domain-containing protein [Oscillatoria sp. PMC 1076.18]MEC4991352.1 NUDIX domain-containing protein [Oscillatoria sp. PMC 1068.18]
MDIIQDASFGIVPLFVDKSEHLFLLIQHQKGHWGFPKGHSETGESPHEAACRELSEETGIQDYQLLPETTFRERYEFKKKGHLVAKEVTYFLAIVKTQKVQIQEEEIKNYAWCKFQEAMSLITYQQSQKVLAEVEAYLHSKAAN